MSKERKLLALLKAVLDSPTLSEQSNAVVVSGKTWRTNCIAESGSILGLVIMGVNRIGMKADVENINIVAVVRRITRNVK